MVDFTLTDEQLALSELAHDFAEREIRPIAWEYDRDSTFPRAIIDTLVVALPLAGLVLMMVTRRHIARDEKGRGLRARRHEF